MTSHVVVSVAGAGFESLGSYAAESGEVHRPATPQLDALAAAGVRYWRYHGNPGPSAGQALLLTGRHAFRTGVSADTIPTVEGPPAASEPFLPLALDSTHICELVGDDRLGTADNGGPLSVLKPAAGVCGFDRALGTHHGIRGPLPLGSQTYFWWERRLTSGGASVLSDLSSLPRMVGGEPHAGTAPLGDTSGPTNRDPRFYATTVTIDDAIARTASFGASPYFLLVSLHAPSPPLHKPPTTAERAQVGLGPLISSTLSTVCTAYENILAGISVAANKAVLAALDPPWTTDDDELEDALAQAQRLAMMEAVDTEVGRLVTAIGAAALHPTTGTVVLWFLSTHGRAA